MDNILAYYVKEYEKQNLFMVNEQPDSPFFQGVRLEMDENKGQGWSELLKIQNGFYVGLADYRLNHQVTTSYKKVTNFFQLSILLSGHFQFQIPGEKRQTVAAGDIWGINGQFEEMSYNVPDEKNLCGLSFTLPHDLIEAWLGSSCCEGSKSLEKLLFGKSGDRISRPPHAVPLARSMGQTSEFIRLTRDIIYSRRQTLPDKLRFESQSLDLLSRILTMDSSATVFCVERIQKVNRIVDEAVDILREEWDNPPTISALARRIRVNECYLKKWFRERMRMSIGAYIRELRMTKALELIETGRYSVLEAAVYVGYSNPGHFSAAFKKYYGRLPSYYLPDLTKIVRKASSCRTSRKKQ